MFALIVGGTIAGLLGAILALPITAAARDVFRYLFHRFDSPPATPGEAVGRIVARPAPAPAPTPGVAVGIAPEIGPRSEPRPAAEGGSPPGPEHAGGATPAGDDVPRQAPA
jgi:hypothetical protein